MFVVMGICLKSKHATQGIYLKAFSKLFNLLEDSGWILKRGDDDGGSGGEDDADED